MQKLKSGDTTTKPGERLDAPRRTYQKPTIIFREPLEAVAAACNFPGGKVNTTGVCTISGS